jgi:polysaccharide pyruvyl transferase WcaK-like protein
LAFALAPDASVDLASSERPPKALFFVTENPPRDVERLNATQTEVMGLYTDLADKLRKESDTTTAFVTTQYQGNRFYKQFGLGDNFDACQRVTSAAELTEAIVGASVVISERLHPSIIAATHGIPFVYLQTTSKSRDLQQLLAAHAPGPIDSCFYDMSRRPLRSLAEAYAAVTRLPELPPTLFLASQAIKGCLQTAAEELIEELQRENPVA